MRKFVKRIMAALLAMILVSGVLAPCTVDAQVVRLNRTSLDFYTGYRANLTLKNAENVRWTSSDKTVAKVSTKGVVTAVDEGSCVIRACDLDTGKQYVCSVKVKRREFSLKKTGKKGTTYSYTELKNLIKTLGDTISSDVKWSSSDESVVYPDEDSGLRVVDTGKVVLKAQKRDRIYIFDLTITDSRE